MSVRKKIIVNVIIIVLILLALNTGPAFAAETTAEYTAPDGLKVVSYARTWQDIKKLQEVYLELQKNFHGDEIKLLSRINIYPGPAPFDSGVAGNWYGETRVDRKGKIILEPGSYINIYNGEENVTIKDIARTLAHEYGHHFTYYYFIKYENKLWEKWAESGYAKARQISGNKKISAAGTSHYWQIQEIAAEDYVQLFGSPTTKASVVFGDIQDRLDKNDKSLEYSTQTFNIQPQENWHLLPTANMPQVREYWLKASGLKDTGNKPPAGVNLRLSAVKEIHAGYMQYIFNWTSGKDDRSKKLEYTLVRFKESNGGIYGIEPVRTVYDGMELTARYGAAQNSQMYMWSDIPPGVSYFVVFVKDEEGLIVSSNILAVDFTDKEQPENISIDDESRIPGVFLRPRVKLDGEQLRFDVPPVIQKGRTMVPLRLIFEKLGAQVNWDGETKTVTATKSGISLKMRIGDKFAEVNGRWVELEVPAGVINGRTLVPLRFVSEAMGADVLWNEQLQLAIIESA